MRKSFATTIMRKLVWCLALWVAGDPDGKTTMLYGLALFLFAKNNALKLVVALVVVANIVACSAGGDSRGVDIEASVAAAVAATGQVQTEATTQAAVATTKQAQTKTAAQADAIAKIDTVLYSGPSYNSGSLDRVARGTELIVLSQNDDAGQWLKVQVAGTQETQKVGWISVRDITLNIDLAGVPTRIISPTPTQTPTPQPTDTPTSTLTPQPTATPTPTPRPTRTPTPRPDAVVSVDVGNLRAGPGTNYDIIGQVIKGDKIQILGKNNAGDWVKASVKPDGQSTRQVGWLSVTLIELNISLSQVLIATIPPTPTPSTPTATPTPKVCPANPALVQIRNYINTSINIKFSGPDTFTVIVPTRGEQNICIPPGNYNTSTSASGYYTLTDTDTFTTGDCQCWDFFDSGTSTPFCTCPNSADSYFRP